MTMAAIGITAAVGAGLSMAKAVIQKKPFGSVLTDGLIGGAIGGVTGGAGLGVSSLLGEGVKQVGTAAITDAAAAPLASAATDAAAQAAAPIVSGATTAATDAAGSVAANIAPTFGQSAAPSLLAEAPSLPTQLGLGPVPPSSFSESPMSAIDNMDKFNPPTISPEVNPMKWGTPGADIPTASANSTLAPEVNSALKNIDNTTPWTNADYTAAINAGSSTLNTGMNLAKSPPSGPANYTQNQYGPQSGASDSLMNSLINLSRS